MTAERQVPKAFESRAGAAVAAAGCIAALLVAVLTGRWDLCIHLILGLLILAFSLLRLLWGLSALLVLFIFEVLSQGYGLSSPARTSGVAVGLLAAPAVIRQFRADGWDRARPSLPSLFLATFLALAVGSAVMAVDLRAWGDGVLKLLLLAALWAVVYASIRSWRDLRTVLWAVFGATCGTALVGILQYAWRFTVPGVDTWYFLDAMRTTGMTTRPHSFAFMLVTAAGYGIALATSSANRLARLAAAVGTVLIAGALATTMTRSSLVFGLGALLVALPYGLRLGTRWRTRFLVACSLFALVAVAGALTAPARARFVHLPAQGGLPAQSRLRTNRTGIAIALHHPLGVGVGNAEHQYDLFRAGDDFGTKGSSHNMYLELAGTVGWPGLACFLLFLWTLHAGAARAETRLRQAGDRRHSLLLAGVRVILYAFAAQGLFWHQILTSKLIWATMGMIGAGTAIALDSKGPDASDCAGRGNSGDDGPQASA